jgi:hypothetical protein
MAEPAQLAWVTRVLGFAAPTVAPQPLASGGAQAIRAAIAAWRAASEAVDGQVGQLQSLLQRSDDPELREIGEYGMAALGGGNRTLLMAALMELDRAPEPTPALLKRAGGIAAKFREHLASDEKVRGFDENPFGLHVSIRATLAPALSRLEAAATG